MIEQPELYKTTTGEYTLYLPEIDETYHSRHGAISESLHVFIGHGLERFLHAHPQKKIQVLEIGFGTGLNALLSCDFANNREKEIIFHTLEPFPINIEIWRKLNYNLDKKMFAKIHKAKWEEEIEINSLFTLKKLASKLEDFEGESVYDVVFFDAFAPQKQPELWTLDIFEKLYALMKTPSVLSTYSAAGQLKRDLKQCGFVVENPPGANGKREMTVALKT